MCDMFRSLRACTRVLNEYATRELVRVRGPCVQCGRPRVFPSRTCACDLERFCSRACVREARWWHRRACREERRRMAAWPEVD